MDFIDRQREISRIQRALHAPDSRFIVIYGRRRLGKSTLIKRALGDRDVYFEADLNEEAIQRSLLVNAIRMTYPELADARYESWDSLLTHFNRVCDANSTLCLDEFPYLVKKNPALPSVIQRLLDSGDLRFNLIICGSSQRMMERLVLDASEPLYGRADEKICLGPIPLPWWEEAFGLDSRRTIEEYSVWGGVPRYWKLREDYEDLWKAIESLIFDEHGILADEPSALFMDDLSEIAPYSSIMTALGSGHRRFSNLADAIGRKVTDLSVPLKNLTQISYIRREVPFGEDPEKSRKTQYAFADPFMAFYYRFVAPNKSYLALGRFGRILDIVSAKFNTHVGAIWERLCAQAVSLNSLDGTEWGVASRWWGNVPVTGTGGKRVGSEEIELDVVVRSLDGSRMLIGECKWDKADYADRLLRVLKAKVSKIRDFEGKSITYALFLRERPASMALPEDCLLLYPDDIIRMLPR